MSTEHLDFWIIVDEIKKVVIITRRDDLADFLVTYSHQNAKKSKIYFNPTELNQAIETYKWHGFSILADEKEFGEMSN